MRTKHHKGDCVSFQKGGPACEDCDLEGHTALCGWHRDWHDCDCGGLEMNPTVGIWLREHNLILVKSFPVLWRAWECDGTWYLCKDPSENPVFVLTECGKPYNGTLKEVEERLNYYRKVLQETEEVLELAKESK